MKYSLMNKNEAKKEYDALRSEYERLKAMNLSLDMTRGKPSPEQMDLSSALFDSVGNDTGFTNIDGIDCRNYGGLDGLSELKKIFSDILDMPENLIIVGGNSSLNMMYDTVAQAMTHGFGDGPWMKRDKVKFLCPVPGYDRHFAICEYFGIEMINVPMTENGPDMDIVEEYVKDESVKGMWCVPKYSNPDGVVYSEDTVDRLAKMETAAKDFRIMYDNAYAIHALYGEAVHLSNIYEKCIKYGHPDRVIKFASTSKITFPGAGVAAEASSPANVKLLKERMSYQTIGPDKLHPLRHARVFPDIDAVKEHMKRHAAVLRPKFEIILDELNKQLGDKDIARWTKPQGGYFISLFVPEGCAAETVKFCKEAGLNLTKAGATYPYGKDPSDSNIRIAPSYPSCDDLKKASYLLCTVIRMLDVKKMFEL